MWYAYGHTANSLLDWKRYKCPATLGTCSLLLVETSCVKTCCLSFHPETSPTRLAVLCTTHAFGTRCSMQARLGPWQSQTSSVYEAMTEPWSDRSAMLNQRMWLLSDQTSCWHNLKFMTSTLSWGRKGFAGSDMLNSPVVQHTDSWKAWARFHGNRPTGFWKQDFLSIYTIYGHSSHLGHVASIMIIDFHFLVPKKYIQNLVENGSVVSEKSKFQFLYINNLGPRSRNDLDLQYSLIYKILGHWLQ